jgi:ABC-type Fe3+ transport system substrate-binding protein
LFIDFLLTPEGQEILLDPKIRRLPVNPKTYAKAPKDFPNPFKIVLSVQLLNLMFNYQKAGTI